MRAPACEPGRSTRTKRQALDRNQPNERPMRLHVH